MCLQLNNSSDVSVPITVAFVDAILTNDQWENDACQTEDKANVFSNYVTEYERNIVLEAGAEETIYPELSLPKEVSTGVRACLVYYSQPTEL
ncbi:hypothetical protein KKG31_03835 [Patescibacteria group bacterium]|nr:hypothetical protein [Patescibacteria group bacterium]MBU1758274.1 hypothetical protein [Patescibacteria group bacterium]